MSPGPPSRATLTSLEQWREHEPELLDAMRDAGFSDASVFAVKLAMEEAIVNGFKHGNKGDESLGVDIDWDVNDERVTLSVEDRGEGFDPADVPDPRDPSLLEVPGGRGLLLMQAYMSEISHNERGNRVTMTYKKPG